MILVAAITAAVDDAGTTETLLFGNVDWCTKPSDTPANTPVRGRLVEAANLRRDMGSGQTLFGAVRPGYGVAVVQIGDGTLDDLARYGWGLRDYTLYGVDDMALSALPAFPAGWTLLLAATVSSAEATETELRLTLRDRLALLDKPACPTFAGSGGTEGGASLAGQPKPYIVGQCCNVEATLVDTNNLIYSFGQAAYCEPRNVWDMRASINPLSSGRNDATSYAGLLSVSLSSGYFARASDAGLFRLGGAPAGKVTVDVIRHDAGYSQVYGRPLIGQVLHDIALDAGLSGAQIDPALESLAGGNVTGYWARDLSTTYLDIIGQVASGRGAWVGCDRAGVLTGGIVEAPAGSPAWTFRQGNAYGVARVQGAFQVPAKSVQVRGGRNWTPMQPSDVAGISMDQLTAIAQSHTYSERATSSAGAKHLNAPDITHDTPSGSVSTVSPRMPGATVGMSAAVWISLFGVERDTLEVTVPLTVAVLESVDLGAVVLVQWPRFGLDAGKLMLCIGVRLSFARQRATFVLWG